MRKQLRAPLADTGSEKDLTASKYILYSKNSKQARKAEVEQECRPVFPKV